MPVGGRVAGKGVGVYNSGGSSDGKVDIVIYLFILNEREIHPLN